MWYFSWALGLPLAAAFAVLNAMWFELMDDAAKRKIHEQQIVDNKAETSA